jgi:hypothetical protein
LANEGHIATRTAYTHKPPLYVLIPYQKKPTSNRTKTTKNEKKNPKVARLCIVYGMCNLAPMMPFAVIKRAARKCPRAIMPTADLQDNPVVTRDDPSLRLPGAIASQSQYATTEGCQCSYPVKEIVYTYSSSCSTSAVVGLLARDLHYSRDRDRYEGLQTQVAAKHRLSSAAIAVWIRRCLLRVHLVE